MGVDRTGSSCPVAFLGRPAGSSPADWLRLDGAGFRSEFRHAWTGMRSRFLKLECWQEYCEPDGNGSQGAYQCGDIRTAVELLKREAEADRPLYDDVRRRGIEYARVRLVQEPLSAYLRYELLSYHIRAAMGENIEIVPFPDGVRLPDDRYFDFLLFDQHTALVHDYGTERVGRQAGGWLTRSPEIIAELARTAMSLRQRGRPLGRYLAGSRWDAGGVLPVTSHARR